MDDATRRSLLGELTQLPRPTAAPTTLVVNAAPGLGRTTLLSRMAADLRAGGAGVDWATASELSTHRPWSVLADAIGLMVPPRPEPGIFDRVLEQIELHAADRLVVVMVDDAHLADAESLAGLGRLGAAGQDMAVRVVLSCRQDVHRERLSMLSGERWVRHVRVGPLDDAAVWHVAEGRLGRRPTAVEEAQLGVAGGNPLHLHRLLDAIAAGRLDEASVPALDVLVDAQLSTLAANSPAAADLVGIVTVWGAPIGADELAALAGLPLMTTMRAISDAIDSGVLRWTEHGRIEIATAIHGAAAYERLAPGLRQLLHTACLAHLRQVNPADPAVTRHLAHTAGAGQSLRDVASTLNDSPGVAADVLAVALQDDALPDVGAIEVERVAALARSGQMAAAADAAASALAAPDLPIEARVTLTLLQVLSFNARSKVADVERLVTGLDRSTLPPAAIARAELLHHSSRTLSGDPAMRARALTTDIDEATAAKGTLPLVMRAIAEIVAGDGISAIDHVEQAAAGFHERANPAELASVDIWPTQFRLYTHGRTDAARQLDEWRQLTANAGQRWVDAYHQGNAAMLAEYEGRLDDAAAEYGSAVDDLDAEQRGWSSWYVGMLARLHLARGDVDTATRQLAAFADRGLPDALGMPLPTLVAAELALTRGDVATAAELVSRTWTRGVDDHHVLWQLLAGPDHLRIAVQLDDDTLASTIVNTLAATDTVRVPALAHTAAFAAAWRIRDLAAAVAAVDDGRERSSRYDAARRHGDCAVLATTIGDTATARQLLTEAVDQLDEIGAPADARALAARLRTLGVRLGARGRRGRPKFGWDALTPTEARIVELVAGGSTGPQIGRTLFISPRTVQTHVSSALAKLGLTTRLQLVTAYTQRAS